MGHHPEYWDPGHPAEDVDRSAAAELEAVALVAHYLIDSVAVMVGSAARLRAGHRLDDAGRQAILARLELHGVHVAEVLAALARGEAIDALTAIAAATDDEPDLVVPDALPDTPPSWAERLGLDIPFDLGRADPPAA